VTPPWERVVAAHTERLSTNESGIEGRTKQGRRGGFAVHRTVRPGSDIGRTGAGEELAK